MRKCVPTSAEHACERNHRRGSSANKNKAKDKGLTLHDSTMYLENRKSRAFLKYVGSRWSIPVTDNTEKAGRYVNGLQDPQELMVSNTGECCCTVYEHEASQLRDTVPGGEGRKIVGASITHALKDIHLSLEVKSQRVLVQLAATDNHILRSLD